MKKTITYLTLALLVLFTSVTSNVMTVNAATKYKYDAPKLYNSVAPTSMWKYYDNAMGASLPNKDTIVWLKVYNTEGTNIMLDEDNSIFLDDRNVTNLASSAGKGLTKVKAMYVPYEFEGGHLDEKLILSKASTYYCMDPVMFDMYQLSCSIGDKTELRLKWSDFSKVPETGIYKYVISYSYDDGKTFKKYKTFKLSDEPCLKIKSSSKLYKKVVKGDSVIFKLTTYAKGFGLKCNASSFLNFKKCQMTVSMKGDSGLYKKTKKGLKQLPCFFGKREVKWINGGIVFKS